MFKSSVLALLVATAATLSQASSVEDYRDVLFKTNTKNFYSSGTLIVGGSETKKGDYLYTVGLRSSKSGRNFCTGSLIDSTHVLTAAHCIGWSGPSWVSIGSHYLSGTKDGQQIKVANSTKHPKYNSPKQMSNDFAILTLEEPADKKYPFVALAASSGKDEEVGMDAITCGWGTMSQGGQQSDVKLEVTVPIVTNTICNKNVTGIDDTMLCAGGEKGKDACQGDSGGPLFTMNKEKEPVLIGVVSWGRGCARENLPGVYSRVSTALAFIKKNTEAIFRRL